MKNIYVTPKKKLGQHFLTDESIAERIATAVNFSNDKKFTCLEIGPGTGVLTKYLIKNPNMDLNVIEIDRESVEYLAVNFPDLYNNNKIIGGDFLKMNLDEYLPDCEVICGNFPYNISSQIFFKILEHKNSVKQVVCMLQREVAQRIANHQGTKEYGILSVFLQAYYNIEYLFGVDEHVFNPPPKVKSAVIRLTRNNVEKLDCDEKLFRTIVKQSFNLRRKMLRNSLAQYFKGTDDEKPFLTLRPEQLSVDDFIKLTRILEN